LGTIETPGDAGLIVIAREPLVAVSAGVLESVTWKMRPVIFCAVVGVPVIAPDVERESPLGSAPLLRAHL
jgi:hypothetical protein